MSKLLRYSSYKESGIEWLGEIPESWETQKMKYLGKIFAGLTDKKGDDFSKEPIEDRQAFIPFTNVCNNIKIDVNQMQYVKIKPFERQNKVQKNDIIFLMSSETLEDIGKSSIHLKEESFYLNSFCKGFRTNSSKCNAEFLNYLLQSTTYRNYFALVGRGFTRINIKQEYINDLFMVLPSGNEQTAIASFLDEKTTQIDQAISQKEKMIELLKERRQIVINEAVTRGINPNTQMKESGVEWIGTIPEHWEIVSNRVIFKEKNVRGNEALPIFMVSIHSAVSSEELSEEENIRGKIRIEDKSQYKMVDRNDIVFNMMRAWQGAIGAVKATGLVSPAYIVATANESINTSYFEYLYRTPAFIQQMDQYSKGIMDFRKRLYWSEFKQLLTVLPPKDEQLQIIAYLGEQTAKIDCAIKLQQNYIDKLKEYKATLIDSVVTGKVRVA